MQTEAIPSIANIHFLFARILIAFHFWSILIYDSTKNHKILLPWVFKKKIT